MKTEVGTKELSDKAAALKAAFAEGQSSQEALGAEPPPAEAKVVLEKLSQVMADITAAKQSAARTRPPTSLWVCSLQSPWALREPG